MPPWRGGKEIHGKPLTFSRLYPPYLRGQAYLLAHHGSAAIEFQKVIDHPGVVANFITAPLVRLQLGRAYARLREPRASYLGALHSNLRGINKKQRD